MKGLKFYALGLAAVLMLHSCGMSNTAKGGLIGGGSGAALGAALGALIGGNAKGAVIGGAAGAALGTGAGILIGKKMDKAKKAAEQVANAQVETVTDANGYQAVKVTFDSGILFQTGKSVLNATAQSSLSSFADAAISTSGNYERYVVIDGKQYTHIIDPATGLPVSGMDSVTVIAPICWLRVLPPLRSKKLPVSARATP